MKRRRWLIPLALIVVLLGCHAAYWLIITSKLASGYEAWAAARRVERWTVTGGAPQRGGWPLAAAVTVPDFRLAGMAAGLPVEFSWRVASVVLRLALFDPRALTVAFGGEQGLRLDGAAEVPFTADRMDAVVPLLSQAPARGLDLAAQQLRIGAPATAVTVAHLSMHILPGQPLSVTADARAVGLPPLPGGEHWALGDSIASLSLDGALTGQLSDQPGLYAPAAFWRDHGGSLALHSVALNWGALELSGNATLTLDPSMQPVGSGAVRVVRPDDALDALSAGGVIPLQAAVAAKAVLGLMAHPAATGGAPEVELPLTLRDRTISAGRIPLARLPQLIWPDAP
jgi:hypothetical protein